MSKYKSNKITYDGIIFDSQKELKRFKELKLLQERGAIIGLELQKPFILAPSVQINGRKKPALKYVCDFYYESEGKIIVEDVKSSFTKTLPVYRIKAHLMKHIHGIDIIEI